jgi:hypothetical protein
MRKGLTAAAALVALLPAVAGAQGALGSELRLNTYTTSSQLYPDLASDGNGDFVAVWGSNGQDGSSSAVIARRFDAAGVPLGPELQVNVTTQASQNAGRVSVAADGTFVVVWNSYGQDGSGLGVFGRRFSASGVPLTGELPINTYTPGDQYVPDVASDPAGNFVAVWASVDQDGSGTGIFGRRFDASGTPLGGEFAVNTLTAQSQFEPAIAASPGGTFVVVWQSYFGDGDQNGVFARVFSSGGVTLPEFPVNTFTADVQRSPAVAMDPGASFVVAWESRVQDAGTRGVIARRFGPTGAPLSGEFQVNTYTTGGQYYPAVATDRDGNFTVAWQSQGQDGSQGAIVARQYDPGGVPLGDEFRVNTFTTSSQERAAVAAVAEGDFVVAWHGHAQDGDSTGVFGQRYGDLIFRDGVETGDLSRWSAAMTDGGDLAVAPEAALGGSTLGLRALVDDTSALFVLDDRPAAENQYRARFYFDPNGFDPGELTNNRRVRLLIVFNAANQRLATIVLRRLGGQYSLMGRVRRDDGTRVDTGFFAVTDAPHFVELRWQRANGANADGGFLLRIDDALVSTLSGIDNGDSPVEFVRLGVMSVKSPVAGGTVYLDQFESRRTRRIGPE